VSLITPSGSTNFPAPIFNSAQLDVAISDFLSTFTNEQAEALKKIDAKSLDPIIFALDFSKQGGTFNWRDAALNQAIRKTREGRIGKLHQTLIGLMPDWTVLPQANADPDLVCARKQLIVELKSRSDTVKGSDQVGIYDNLLTSINGAYRQHTALFGFILNKSLKSFTKPLDFTPSDNSTHQTRQVHSNIKQVDGKVLWAIACDPRQGINPPYSRPNAIFDVYRELFESIYRVSGSSVNQTVINNLNSLAVRNFTPRARAVRKKSSP
jgi:hypothetical protein